MTTRQLRDLGEYALRARAEYADRPADDRAVTTESGEPVLTLSTGASWAPWPEEDR